MLRPLSQVFRGSTSCLPGAGVYPGHSVSYTLSIPPLEVTSFTIAPASLAANQLAVFTATHTGGTGPLHLFFGDDEGAVVTANAGTCSITHDYDSDDTFHVVVTVRGASTSDLQTIQFTITIP